MNSLTSSDNRAASKQARLGYRHQKVQRLRKLLRRSALRESEGVFVIEGAKLLEEALDAGVAVESVFVAPEAKTPVVQRAYDAGFRIYDLEDGVMERIGDATTPQPVCAIVPITTATVEEAVDATTVVVLVDVRDPGNAGTIMRSAEASGVGLVAFCSGSVDVWNPKTVRSSAGSIFHQPVIANVEVSDVLAALHFQGFVVAGTTMDAPIAYDEADLTRKIAFVFGNEANGLSQDTLDQMDELLSIPIVGRSESLNVSMAASVLCFEAARQKRGLA